LQKRAARQLREHHDFDHVDAWVAETFKATSITFLRPM